MQKTLLAMMTVAALGVSAGSELLLNREKLPFEPGNDSWSANASFALTRGTEANAVLKLAKNGWKKHAKHAYITGYNGDITLRFQAPGPVTELTAKSSITNYADAVKRGGYIAWSLDGIKFTRIAAKDFTSGTLKLSGEAKLPANRGYVYLRFGRDIADKDSNGEHGFVLFTELAFSMKGTYAPAVKSGEETSRGLKSAFPTGVFWPWERTKPNADYAKMELWAFVEHTMKTLKAHGYDTLWFVNLGGKDMPRVLEMAEKHGVRALLNTDLISIFYHGANSMDSMESLAESTVARLGGSKALLGYVLKDEPLLCDLETCSNLYKLMKNADPERDSTAVVMNRQSMSFLRDSNMPVICSDIYYFGSDRTTQLPWGANSQVQFTNALRSFGDAAELYNKHSWFMGQMFGDVWGRHWRKGDKMVVEPGAYLHWKMPSQAESRWQIWEALRLGSKGIFFYVLYPPIQLEVAPDQAKEPWQKNVVERMDKAAKTAGSWKNQPLTTATIERDPGEGMLDMGGRVTPQVAATAPVMKLIRKYEKLLVERRKASFPVFFSGDHATDCATFESGDRMLGIVVNRDLKKDRKLDVLLSENVTGVINLGTMKKCAITRHSDGFQKFSIDLKAGDGALFEAEFKKQPGMRFCHESFDQNSVHRLTVNKNAEVFNHGEYGADANRSLRLTGDPSQPVCALLNLTNPKTSQRTFGVNLNGKKQNGVVYCLVRGNLSGASVRAVRALAEGEKANIMHLTNLTQSGVQKAAGSQEIKNKDFFMPVVVPAGTTALEFYLSKPTDRIEEITVWFVPR